MDQRIRHRKGFRIGCSLARRASRKFRRDERGVTAVEFALLAPMLVFGLLATVDVGLALSERMAIGHALRAGAQSATEDAGLAAIEHVLRTTAAKNLTVAAAGATGSDSATALSVSRICACAAHPDTSVACSTTCDGDTPTQVFYALSGRKTYAGLILPRFTQSQALMVQVR